MDVDRAISRCPFLHNVSLTQGHAYASSIACNPLVPAVPTSGSRRPILEESQDLAATFRLFHGREGIVPLVTSSFTVAPTCSQTAFEPPPVERVVLSLKKDQPHPPKSLRDPFASAPLAAMSLGMVSWVAIFIPLS